MKLRFPNRVGNLFKQLHTDVAEQLFAVVDNPTAPRARARAKTLVHPRCASSHKLRFGLSSRFGFGTESIAQLGEGTGII
jgi:hypothetical protein